MNRAMYCGLMAAALLFQEGTAWTQKILPEGIKDLATQIATNAGKEQKHKIAVLPFRELGGQPTVLGSYISEELVSDLFAVGGLEIIERSMLDKIISEIKLDQSGLINPETAKKIGSFAGADAIVTGTITDLQSYVALNCRLIDARTGRVFGAAQARIVKDADVTKLMQAALPTPSHETEKPAKPAAPATQDKEEQGFVFSLKTCTASGTSVRCDLLVVNRGDDRYLTIATNYDPDVIGASRLFTADGDEKAATEVALGNSRGPTATSLLISGVATKAWLVFVLPPEAHKAALVEIAAKVGVGGIWSGNRPFHVQFRDVPLIRR